MWSGPGSVPWDFEALANSGVGSWKDTKQLQPTVPPVVIGRQKDTGPPALRKPPLASSGNTEF